MKSYEQVIREKYDPEAGKDVSTTNNLQWIGPQLYLYRVIFDTLRVAIENGLDLGTARVLEVGCGEGRWTRYIAEVTKHPELIAGTDLSQRRVEVAQKLNPAINYRVSDLVDDPIQGEYDLILAWDVFTHLESKEQIQTALKRIHSALSPKGIFVFFDIWIDSHFSAPLDADAWGYNPEEIKQLAHESGFESFYVKTIFKVLPRLGHSEALYRSYPEWFVRSAEKILPGKPGNFFMLFRKENDGK